MKPELVMAGYLVTKGFMKKRSACRSAIVTFCLLSILSILQAEPYSLPETSEGLSKIPWLKETQRKEDRIWKTKYDFAQKERDYPSRIVSYAGKWTRHNFGGHGGLGSDCGWRFANSDMFGAIGIRHEWNTIVKMEKGALDIDGDGQKDDDWLCYFPFSMEVPLGIPDWPASNTFPERLSATFYGGMTYYCANNDIKKAYDFLGEMGVNPDHSTPFMDDRAEDHPMNGMRHVSITGSYLKHYAAMIWKKEDFLNNGNKHRVSFDDNSRLSILCTRGYWYGFNDIRMIVKNKDTFYISEIAKDIPDYAFKDAGKLKKPSGFNPIMYPTKLRWAVYKPEGYKVDIDPAKCKFEKVKFDDVQAVGWYLAKTDTSNANTHCKWYGFECDAIVHTPAEPSPRIEMKEIKGKQPPFYMATCELPYALWQDIVTYGDSPSHVLQARYIYDKTGSMGSMAYGKREHQHDEPLTDITFYDALAICNTLSEMEGKTPCYYLDPEFKTVFRNQHIATQAHWGDKTAYERRNFQSPLYRELPLAKVYVKWAANGHRLPTVAEWKDAAGGNLKSEISNLKSTDGTAPVGSRKPNEHGIYDMIGNVWELCWTQGDVYDPEKNEPVAALGGDYNYPASPEANPASPYGDKPFAGVPSIGIRLVCRESDQAKPEVTKPEKPSVVMGNTPEWSFRRNDLFGKKAEPAVIGKRVLDMVKLHGGAFVRSDKMTVKVAPFEIAKYTVTYDRWKTVKQWAEAKGYHFGRSGDMGSMLWFDFTHDPEEPVTNIDWHDMITWCNALSEMEGKAPCYFYDEARTKVVRKAFGFKAIKVDGAEYIKVERDPILKHEDGSYAGPYIFTSWDADGYRMPTSAEYEFAVRGGVNTKFFWGDDPKLAGDYLWNAMNAQGRTHKVGLKKPNPYGLYDIQGNVFKLSFSLGHGSDPTRPHKQDIDNPIRTPYWAWGKDKKEAPGVRGSRDIVGGPSYLHGGFDINGEHGIIVESGGFNSDTHYYADIGFVPVRCEAGTHPKDGIRPLVLPPVIKYIQIDESEFFNYSN